eukprot:CAMPEP_0181298740 /NCGR_PEP_ID=MMETSP1101-20121128/5948_1 /TAXON_ID=46948 /ORGANISM="Rhodomonas abbreviata, Strain Caron Lab Isolate" /LENGTH=90 /DNA_ID=CAMNT_0023403791 /DNA_START=14 /DNA_END=286 /DNA_ORIENTATION=-
MTFSLIRSFHELKQSLHQSLLGVTLGDNGYPENPWTNCVEPVPPENWLTYVNGMDKATAMQADGLSANLPMDSNSAPKGNNMATMCIKGY